MSAKKSDSDEVRPGTVVEIDPIRPRPRVSGLFTTIEMEEPLHDDTVDAFTFAMKAMEPAKIDLEGKPLTLDSMSHAIDKLISPEERREMERRREEDKLRAELAKLRPLEMKLAAGFDLDKIGSALAMVRSPGETDVEYRERIKKMLSATHDFEKANTSPTPPMYPVSIPETDDRSKMSDLQLQRELRRLRRPVGTVYAVDVDGREYDMEKIPSSKTLTDRAWDCAAQNVMRIFEALKAPNSSILVPESATWPMIRSTRGEPDDLFEAIMFPRDPKRATSAIAIQRDERPRPGELIFASDESSVRSLGIFYVDNFIRYCMWSGLKDWLDAMLNASVGLSPILDDVGFLRVTHIEITEWMSKLSTADDIYPVIPKHVVPESDVVRIHVVFSGSISTYLDFPVRGDNDA